MSAVLQNVFNELQIDNIELTEREFSRKYLGKSGSYLAMLKSTKTEASANCLLKLFGTLSKEKHLYEKQLRTYRTERQKQIIERFISRHDKLRGQIYSYMVLNF